MPKLQMQIPKPGLLRQLGFFSATALVISNMVGMGIFGTTGQNLTAAGTTQATAITLSNDINEINTVPANSGVTLAALQPAQQIWVFNTTGNPLKVYPASGYQIDALGLNAPYSLAGHKDQIYTCTSQNQIRSLQLG